jgi:hypothetical protein
MTPGLRRPRRIPTTTLALLGPRHHAGRLLLRRARVPATATTRCLRRARAGQRARPLGLDRVRMGVAAGVLDRPGPGTPSAGSDNPSTRGAPGAGHASETLNAGKRVCSLKAGQADAGVALSGVGLFMSRA